MIRVQDLLAEETQLRKEIRPTGTEQNIIPVGREEGAIKLVSRERLLRYDGEALVGIACKSLAGREATQREKLVYAKHLRGGQINKRDIFNAYLQESWNDWQQLWTSRWLIDRAAADSLTVGEWLNFSLRFLWYRLRNAWPRKTA
jgi:hypothetical protein